MRTKAQIGEYKGFPVITIWEVDKNDNPVGKYPIISMGKKKASAVIGSVNALREFIAQEDEAEVDL